MLDFQQRTTLFGKQDQSTINWLQQVTSAVIKIA